MGLKDSLANGLNRAVKATESAIDEGKHRVAAFQARQRADKKAEALGYALARAKASGVATPSEEIARLTDEAVAADAEASALENRQ